MKWSWDVKWRIAWIAVLGYSTIESVMNSSWKTDAGGIPLADRGARPDRHLDDWRSDTMLTSIDGQARRRLDAPIEIYLATQRWLLVRCGWCVSRTRSWSTHEPALPAAPPVR